MEAARNQVAELMSQLWGSASGDEVVESQGCLGEVLTTVVTDVMLGFVSLLPF